MSGSPVMNVLGQGQAGNGDRSQDRGRAVGQGQQIAEPANLRVMALSQQYKSHFRRFYELL